MTSRAGMHFPCCCERRDGEPSGKLNPIEEAVLRQFIRFGIPRSRANVQSGGLLTFSNCLT